MQIFTLLITKKEMKKIKLLKQKKLSNFFKLLFNLLTFNLISYYIL